MLEKISQEEVISESLKLSSLSLSTFYLSLAENINKVLMRNTGKIMYYLHRMYLFPVIFVAHKYLTLLIYSAEYS